MLRQGSLRDERRRRSLLEDAAVAAEDSVIAKPRRSARASETYTEMARADCHARWSDFVPLRNWTIAAFLAAGLASIAVLEVAYFFVSRTEPWTGGGLAALDLARAESLAGWFVALTLFAAAVLSLFVYSVRRYRLDDYRGRYRVWMWSGTLWLVMSIDAAADLRGAVQAVCIALSGHIGPLDGIVWWLAPWSLLVAWLGVRMVLDMRGCRTATGSLCVGLGLLPASLVVRQIHLPLAARDLAMITAGCWLVGCWLLLFAHAAYARHVLLDAHGQLPVRAPRPKREKKARPAADAASKDTGKTAGNGIKRRDDLTTRIDPAHSSSFRAATSGIDLQKPAGHSSGNVKPLPAAAKISVGASSAAAAKPPAAPAKVTQFISGRDEEEDSRPAHKLSRAERKRLRKQQRGGRDEDE
jgi:hypothetical protein